MAGFIEKPDTVPQKIEFEEHQFDDNRIPMWTCYKCNHRGYSKRDFDVCPNCGEKEQIVDSVIKNNKFSKLKLGLWLIVLVIYILTLL